MPQTDRTRPRARLLVHGACSPARNMAVDEALARLCGGPPALRLYAWSPPALSLGARQPLADVAGLREARPDLTLVRRPTGGGAIVHENELTYALIGRYDAFGARGRTHPRTLYLEVHAAIADAVRALGAAAPAASTPATGGASGSAPGCCPPLCFERETDYDLVIPPHGKLAGSAQRRFRRTFLQHGSIRLAAGRTVPRGATTLDRVLGRSVGFDEAAQAVTTALADRLGLDLDATDLTASERSLASTLEAEVYGDSAWTARAVRSGMYPDGDTESEFSLSNKGLCDQSHGPDLALR